MEDVLAVILGGGRGTRLHPLTEVRAKPAVPLGGKYRLIDIPISNCLHDAIEKIYVLTQFNSHSLNRHISQTYRFDTFSTGFVEILAAEQTADNPNWYQGTADAVRQQLRHMMNNPESQFMVLSGDHLYRMNYRSFVGTHREREADLTIAVKPVTREKARQFGILKMDEDGRIQDFVEKPDTEEQLDELRIDPPENAESDQEFMASMGIYVFERDVLEDVLHEVDQEDFGKHIIPAAIETRRVFAHSFNGYWEDIGTIDSFYNANLALTEDDPPFKFYEPGAPIYTHPRYLEASRVDGCQLDKSIVGDGSNIRNAKIERSVVGLRSQIGPGVHMSHTIMMGADFYEQPSDRDQNRSRGVPDVGIGQGSRIDGAIIDKNARIGRDVTIKNVDWVEETEEDNYAIRDGIVVVPKDAVIPDGTVI